MKYIAHFYDGEYHQLDYSRYTCVECDAYDDAITVCQGHNRAFITDSNGVYVRAPWDRDPDNFFDEE